MLQKLDDTVKKSNGLAALLIALIPVLGDAVANAFKGSLNKTQDAVTVALKSTLTKMDNGLDKGLEAFKNFESSNPIIEASISESQKVLTSLGLEVPTAAVLEAHIKAALFDIFSGIDAQLKADAETAPKAETEKA